MPWYDSEPPRSRQYAIRTRRCRQRVAQRLGAGLSLGEVAAAERLHPREIETLLGDAGFRDLVRHYGELEALPEEERRRRLVLEARRLLELGLAAGDLRIAAFVVREDDRQNDPATSLARDVMAEARRLARPPDAASSAGQADGQRDGLAEAPFAPPAEPKLPGAAEADFAACAGTFEHLADAEALAAAELGRVGRRLGSVKAMLKRRLLQELERQGTANAAPDRPLDERRACAFARLAHADPAAGMRAAAELHGRRETFRQGAPPPRPGPDMAVAAADAPAHRAVGPPGEESPAAVAPPTEADARALPDWLDRVDCRVRQTALLLPPHELPPYLERLARFYGYDTS